MKQTRIGGVLALAIMMALATAAMAQLDERTLEHNLDMARKYLRESNLRLAENYAKKVLAESPGDLAAQDVLRQVQRAHAHNIVGAPGPATADDADALLAAWRDPEASLDDRKTAGDKLSDVYLDKAQGLLKRRGNEVQALLALRKAKILNADNGWVHYELFKLFHKLGRLDECLPHAKRFLELVGFGVVATDVRRKLVEVQVQMGDNAVKESRWDRAAKHFAEVLTLEPSETVADETRAKLATALRTLFYQLHGAKQYVEAADYLDRLMALRPTDAAKRSEFDSEHYFKVRRFGAEVFWRAILALRERRKFDRAIVYIGRLLESGPSTKRRTEALALKDKLVQEQVATAANETLGESLREGDDNSSLVEPATGGNDSLLQDSGGR